MNRIINDGRHLIAIAPMGRLREAMITQFREIVIEQNKFNLNVSPPVSFGVGVKIGTGKRREGKGESQPQLSPSVAQVFN